MANLDILNTLRFQENLGRYLKGLSSNTYELSRDLEKIGRFTYSGYVFRGMAFNHPIDKHDIHEHYLCSWSKDIDTAVNFALTNGRFKFLLIKRSTGYDLEKLLEYMKSNNLIVSKTLATAGAKREKEVLDKLTLTDTIFTELL